MTDTLTDTTGQLTHTLADFAVSFDLRSAPERVLTNAKCAILDCLGVAVLATSHEIGTALKSFAREIAAPGDCTIWGTGLTTSARDAALLNGTLAHGLDFDDRGHSSTYCLATPAAWAEQQNISGARLLEAFIVGKEVRSSLEPLFASRASGIGPGARGWHGNGLLGPIAAAVAAGKIIGLDRRAMLAAIGLATGSCAALTRDAGTMAKPFRCGQAAASGLVAALLAKHGLSADATVLEGHYGLLDALAPIAPETIESLGQNLGTKFHLEPDLRGKIYASCTSSHSGLEAMLRLAKRAAIDPESVETIECDFKPHRLLRERPTRGYEGRFSMPFCLAIALIHHRLDHDDFTDETVKDPMVQNIMRRSRHTPGAPSLVIALKNGDRLIETAKHPTDITEWDQFATKFRACVEGLLTEQQAETVIDLVGTLENLPKVRQLTAALQTKAD